MNRLLLTALLLLCLPAVSTATESLPLETRCGWFDNPSPGNASLFDRDDEWVIAMQGEYEARGEWPRFKRSEWVNSGNGSMGYGCACMKVRVARGSHKIIEIRSARAQALAICRRDKSLKEPGKEGR